MSTSASKRQPHPSRAASAASAPRSKSGTATATASARAALAWLHTTRFLTTASKLAELPGNELPEIAFVGRSNAGKSTAINTLAQQRQLAFASRTPGRTQHINLFEVGPKEQPDVLLADLPGYGYAAVERAAKLRWQQVMSEYLQVRRPLHGVVQMIDSRHGFTELDQRLLALLQPRIVNGEVRLLVLLTKADKLNRRDAAFALATAQELLAPFAAEAADVSVTLFSALKLQGVGDVAEALHSWGVRSGAAAAPDSPPAPNSTSPVAVGEPGAAA